MRDVLAASLVHLPAGYGYFALVIQHGALPFGSAAVWLGAWGWVPVIGLFVLISVRFPDGKVSPRWRVVDWLAVSGTALFALGIALHTPKRLVDFLPVPGAKVALLAPLVENPLSGLFPERLLSQVQGAGLSLLILACVALASSLTARFRRAGSDERLQLKWFAYSSGLFAATLVYGAPAWNFFGQPLYLALTPLEFAGLTLPVAIAVAILRYRLYDIDLIINRTLVYGGLTAILGAVYAAVVTPLNRLFISASGQKSDAAYVVTAFVVVVASSPVKDWLQRQVDRRVRHRSPAAVLDEFRADVESVVSVIDVNKVACRLLDEAVIAFDARAAALYLTSNPASGPVYSHGRMNGEDAVEVLLRHEGRELGRLVLGGRRGQIGYSQADLRLLQRSADTVSEVLVLAAHLGHRQLTEAR